jgi:Zn-dependent protease with chaperone function
MAPSEMPATEQTDADAERARQYERGSLWLRLFNLGLVTAALLLFLLSGASVSLRDWVEDVTGNAWLQVAIFTVVLLTVWSLITLPWEYVTDFRREHRYGLSNQSTGAWLWDQVKGFLLSLVLGVLVLEVLYLLLREAGDLWWLWAAGGMVLFSITLTSLGPVLFIPIFYKLQRIEDPELTERLTRVAEREGARVIGVYRMDMSSKTRRANAMVAGLGRTQRIILGDTLLEGFTPEEIEVVVAHEVAHYKHRDLWTGIIVSAVLTLVGLFIASRVLDALADRGPLEGRGDLAALPLLLLSLGVYGLITMPLGNLWSRWRETEADRAALRATGMTGPFIGAMRRLASLNLANPEPNPLVEAVFYSHPSIARRVAMAERFEARASGTAGAYTGGN